MSRTNRKTRLQRDILIMAYDYPDMTQAEIADYLGCSSSYVSQVLRKFDNQRAMRTGIEGFNQDLGIEPMDFDLGFSDDDFEDVNLEDLGPIGVVLVAGVFGAVFLIYNPLQTVFLWYGRWLVVALCAIAILGVGFVFYSKFKSDGLGPAVKWFFGSFDSTEQSGDNSPQANTTPVPERLKNELYFERANQKCEWCDEQTDSPDIHHIKPRKDGGSNDPQNLAVLCPNCHRNAEGGIISRSRLRYKIKA